MSTVEARASAALRPGYILAPGGDKHATSGAEATPRRRPREVLVLGILSVGLGVLFVVGIALGSVRIPLSQVVLTLVGAPAETVWHTIIHDVRLPRSITAVLAGAALGVAGLQMQTLLRNPLADPFVLGITSGASLGVALVVLASGSVVSGALTSGLGLGGDLAIAVAAILGAMLVLGPALAIASRVANPATVLILGLMFGYAISAFVTILVAGAAPEQLQRWVTWGFGSFGAVTWNKLLIFGPVTTLGILMAAASTKQLNVLLLGESYARSMGLNAKVMRIMTMLGASVLAGVVTAFCGPIAFLGIAIPHLARGLLGTSDHRVLIPAVVLLGGIVALFAQIVALLPGLQGTLPLNAVTSMIGAPVVIFILLRNRRGAFTG